MPLHLSGAGAGRRNDVITMFKFGKNFAGQRLGNIAGAGVVAGLAATSLCLGKDNLATGILQKLARCKADVGADKVHEAGNKEANFHTAI